MPDPISSPASTSSGALFAAAGMTEKSQDKGLFGLLLAFQGGTVEAGDQSGDLTKLPGELPGRNVPLVTNSDKLPTLPLAGQALPGLPEMPDLTSLPDFLKQQGAENSPLGKLVQKLAAAEQPLTSEQLSTELAQLNDEDQGELLGQLQALLMPLPTPVLPEVMDKVEASLTIAAAQPKKIQPPLPVDQPERVFLPLGVDKGTSESGETLPQSTAPEKPKAGLAIAAGKIGLNGLTEVAAPAPMNAVIEQLARNFRDAGPLRELKTPEPKTDKSLDLAPPPAVPALSGDAVAPIAVPPTATPTKGEDTAKFMPAMALASKDPSAVDASTKQPLPDAASAITFEARPQPQNSFVHELNAIKATHGTPHTPMAEQIGVQMQKGLASGQERIVIRLQPPELGRIDVKLEVSGDGRVTASISADNPLTLDLMKRDQAGLERALTDAGLKTDSGSLNFQSRNDGQAFANPHDGQKNHGQSGHVPVNFQGDNDEPVPPVVEMSWSVSSNHVDVRI